MINTKCIKVFAISILAFFIFTQSKSEVKVAFVEMDKIIRESLVGKDLIKKLDEADTKNQKFFTEKQKKLKLKKDKISSQKNILSKEEYEKNVIAINKEYELFKNEGNKKINSLKSKRNTAMKKIFDELNPILSEYSNKNELTFIMDQKNIIIGQTDLNITSEIIKILNLKIKKISMN